MRPLFKILGTSTCLVAHDEPYFEHALISLYHLARFLGMSRRPGCTCLRLQRSVKLRPIAMSGNSHSPVHFIPNLHHHTAKARIHPPPQHDDSTLISRTELPQGLRHA